MAIECKHLEVFTSVVMAILVLFIVMFLLFLTTVAVVSRKTKSIMHRLRQRLDELQNKDYNVIKLVGPSSNRANQEHPVPPLDNMLSQHEPEYAVLQMQNTEKPAMIQNTAYGNNSRLISSEIEMPMNQNTAYGNNSRLISSEIEMPMNQNTAYGNNSRLISSEIEMPMNQNMAYGHNSRLISSEIEMPMNQNTAYGNNSTLISSEIEMRMNQNTAYGNNSRLIFCGEDEML